MNKDKRFECRVKTRDVFVIWQTFGPCVVSLTKRLTKFNKKFSIDQRRWCTCYKSLFDTSNNERVNVSVCFEGRELKVCVCVCVCSWVCVWNMSITTIVTNCFSQCQVIICIGCVEAINNRIHVICFMILFKTFMAQFTSNNDSCCSRFKTQPWSPARQTVH